MKMIDVVVGIIFTILPIVYWTYLFRAQYKPYITTYQGVGWKANEKVNVEFRWEEYPNGDKILRKRVGINGVWTDILVVKMRNDDD